MHICIGNNTPKAPNPMGCIYDLGISNPYNQLLYLVLCICVKNVLEGIRQRKPQLNILKIYAWISI